MSSRSLRLLAWLTFASGTYLRSVGETRQGNRLVSAATLMWLGATLQARRGL